MAFNPILETNIQPTQAVQKPSAAGAAVNLLSGLFPERKEKPVPSRSDLLADAKMNTLRGMESAQQQGDMATVLSLGRNFFTSYGVGTAPEVDNAFTLYSGQDPSRTTYGQSSALLDIKKQPDFVFQVELARVNLGNTATQEAIEQEAIRLTQNRMSTDAKIKNETNQQAVDWYALKPAYEEKTRALMAEVKTMIDTINQDDIISVEDAKLVRDWHTNNLANIVKPPNVSDAEWATWKTNNVTPLELVINAGLDNMLEGGASDDMNRALKGILDVAVAKGYLVPSTMVILGNPNADPSAKMEMLTKLAGNDTGAEWLKNAQDVLGMTYEQQLNWVRGFENADIGFIKASVDTSAFTALTDPAAKEASLMVDVTMMSASDPGQAATALINLSEKLKSIPDSVITADFLGSIFNPSFFTQIERLDSVNHDVTTEILKTTKEAMGNHMASMESHIVSIARQNGFKIAANASGQYNFMLNPEFLTPEARAELDTYFGGSIAAAEKSRGLFTEARVSPTGEAGYSIRTPNLKAAFDEIGIVKDELNKYSKLMDAFNKLDGKINPAVPEQKPQGKPVSALGTDFQVPESIAQDTEFLSAVEGSSTRLQIQPDWLLRVIDFETASTWSPQIKNPGSTATGLIQFLESTAKGLGTSTDELRSMTRGQQMAYVEKYLEPYKGRLNNFGDVYMAVHWPAGIGKDEGYVMYKKGSAEYDVNRNLDSNGDGTVTRGETLARVLGATGRGTAVPYASHDVGTAATGPYVPAPSGQPFVPQDYSPSPLGTPTPTAPVVGTSNTPPVVDRGYQPATMTSPEATPQAVAAPYDADVQSFLDTVRNGYETAKSDKALQFNSAAEVETAKAEGKVKEGDVVMIKGKPVVVW